MASSSEPPSASHGGLRAPDGGPDDDPGEGERKVFQRLEQLLADEFGLSRFKRAMATQFIKKVRKDGESAAEFKCVRMAQAEAHLASGVARQIGLSRPGSEGAHR